MTHLQWFLIQQSKRYNIGGEKIEIYGIELQVLLGLGTAIAVAALWAMKNYQQINADGKITLSEAISTIEEAEDYVDEIVKKAEELEKALMVKKKTELVILAKEKGIPSRGTKADIVERLTAGDE